jgi:predicted NUDIX family NTP pyrophosphohydrolase
MEYSSGIILYRDRTPNQKEFFLAHPGGVFYRTFKKGGYWVFPKGHIEKTDWHRFPQSVTNEIETDAALYAAIREYHEETGDTTDFQPFYNQIQYIGKILQRKDKTVYAFALECTWDLDVKECYSNTIVVEVNGEKIEIPENDAFMWATYDELKNLTHPKHLTFYKKIIEKWS